MSDQETDERARGASGLRLTVLVAAWPVLSETFVRNEVAALRRAGHAVLVEASERGDMATAPRPERHWTPCAWATCSISP